MALVQLIRPFSWLFSSLHGRLRKVELPPLSPNKQRLLTETAEGFGSFGQQAEVVVKVRLVEVLAGLRILKHKMEGNTRRYAHHKVREEAKEGEQSA
jgi:hypothetical protein